MNQRETPLLTPPERPPYFRVTAPGDVELVLRRPSLPVLASLLRSLGRERQARLLALGTQLQEGVPLLPLLLAADDVLPLLAALVGIAWSDPVWALSATMAEGEDLGAYGARVHEELHEAGWELSHLVLAALAVADQVQRSAQLQAEVAVEAARRTAFFRATRASSSESVSPSRPTTSGGGEDEA